MSTKKYPTVEYLRQCLRYENGKLFWINRPLKHFVNKRGWGIWNSQNAGKEAGYVRKRAGDARWIVTLNGTKYCRYRLIWLLHKGRVAKLLDHKNRNSLDDRIENLRIASHSQNKMNIGLRKTNTSGVKGVHWCKRERLWQARITVNYKMSSLGYFVNINDARIAREEGAKRYHGEFAYNG